MKSAYRIQGDGLEVRASESSLFDKRPEDILMCLECNATFTRAQALDTAGTDERCPECDAALWDFDADEDEKS